MNKLLLILGLGFALVILAFRPIDTSRENSIMISGTLLEVTEGGYKDAGFILEGKKGFYYINRGLVSTFTLAELKKLKGQTITLMYAKHWSLFGLFFTQGYHITELRQGKTVLYSEFEK